VFKFPTLRGLHGPAQAAIVFTYDVDVGDGCFGSPPCYACANLDGVDGMEILDEAKMKDIAGKLNS
jgi:hypothetical protein